MRRRREIRCAPTFGLDESSAGGRGQFVSRQPGTDVGTAAADQAKRGVDVIGENQWRAGVTGDDCAERLLEMPSKIAYANAGLTVSARSSSSA